MQNTCRSPQQSIVRPTHPTTITAGNFDAIVKLCSIAANITKAENIIIVANKIGIKFCYGLATMTIDVSSLLRSDHKEVDKEILDIVIPSYELSTLKQFKGNVKVKEVDGGKVDFCDGNIRISLNQNGGQTEDATIPNDNVDETILSSTPLTNILSIVRGYLGKTSYTDLHIFDTELLGLRVAGKRTFNIDASEDAEIPDHKLRSFTFCKVPGKKVTMEIFRVDDNYYLLTKTEAGANMEVTVVEQVYKPE